MESMQYITLSHFCQGHQINQEFIVQLYENDLVELVLIKNEHCIPIEELPKTEKIVRLYAELNINLEGIEVITRLLEQMRELKEEITYLRNKLSIYEK